MLDKFDVHFKYPSKFSYLLRIGDVKSCGLPLARYVPDRCGWNSRIPCAAFGVVHSRMQLPFSSFFHSVWAVNKLMSFELVIFRQ
jgi:hypothetical protein